MEKLWFRPRSFQPPAVQPTPNVQGVSLSVFLGLGSMVGGVKSRRGCETCKKRRIKCDEGEPQCNRCVRSGWKCPGYPLKMMVKDQRSYRSLRHHQAPTTTTTVPRRQNNQLAIIAPKQQAIAPANRCGISKELVTSAHTPRHIPKHLDMPLEEVAVDFFFAAFHSPDDSRLRTGYLDLLPSVFKSSRPNSLVSYSTIAVSCAAVGSICGSAKEKTIGSKYFAKAISAVKGAIQNETTRENDETLVAILLLRIYEALQSVRSAKQVGSIHARGAAALVQLRSRKDQDKASARFTNTCRLELMTMSIWGGEPIADVLNDDSLSLPLDHPLTSLVSLASTASTLLTVYKNFPLSPAPTQEAISSLLQQAIEIDNDILDWHVSLPKLYFPGIIDYSPDKGEPKLVAQSQNPFTRTSSFALLMNRYRTSRLMAQYVILGCLSRLGNPELSSQLESTRATIQDLVDGICNSLPPYMREDYQTDRHAGLAAHCSHEEMIRYRLGIITGTWSLLPYLSFVAKLGFKLREGQMEWIQNRIRQIYVFFHKCETNPI
ncbi:hypothetical protein AJ79_02221 [Helicocarpus griseus UAMH5409]|uniref:Zn(2)-C6 fungal-type domain-containing protein n=1 Tax=Helicocarpus griseus UAMH5409 TaxID=1447875 RepID=A0A2B7Y3L9_9EURO|nr:hypothetical protein AJ79_02221 [Helicocarpus griseus UAMH5409]